jgi:hypothetical protein
MRSNLGELERFDYVLEFVEILTSSLLNGEVRFLSYQDSNSAHLTLNISVRSELLSK